MASNDYYQPSQLEPSRGYHDYLGQRVSSPPAPTSQSPFDDGTHPYPPGHPYTGAAGRLHDDGDPFDDDNAIPLNGRQAKHDSSQTVSPVLPHEQEDPFVRDAKQRKQKKQPIHWNGWFRGQVPWVVYVLTVTQLAVFIAQLAKNGILTGSPIQTRPSFNPMIGPSPYVLINMGARYQPCMHTMKGVQDRNEAISWPCPNATSTAGESVSCQLSDLCGFSPDKNPRVNGNLDDQPAPNQWWRFIAPIFLHAGIIHIGFNMLLQVTLGRDVEKLIGSFRFAILYAAAGIFGFVLGGNFAATGIASTGCSGSLFGILAITFLDLVYHWKERKNPTRELIFIFVDISIAFVLGLLPGLDNFSHIGGFLMGLVLGVCLLRPPPAIARRTSEAIPAYSYLSRQDERGEGIMAFAHHPLGFFKNRRSVWWAWWLVRAAALLLVLIAFLLLLKNFYVWHNGCSWCKYLSCLPVKVGNTDWCNVGNLQFTSSTTSTDGSGNSKRDLMSLTRDVLKAARRH